MKKHFTFNLSQDRSIVHHFGNTLLRFIATMLFLFYLASDTFAQTGKITGKLSDLNIFQIGMQIHNHF